jgi:DHA1 family bicyclomycin/chloramphenicol resistance-like MFS transporter
VRLPREAPFIVDMGRPRMYRIRDAGQTWWCSFPLGEVSDPRKDTMKRRNLIVIVLGALTAIGPFSIDMYLPGFPAIARTLGTDIAHVGLTLTSYFIGISLGQLGYGPALDRFGRKRPVLLGLFIYIAAAVGCAFSPSISYLIAMRFFLAIGSCVGIVAASAMVRDLFSGKEVARALSMLMTVFGIAPIIAPTMGGYIVSTLGWRYIFGVLAVIGALVLIAVSSLIHDTRGPDRSLSLHPAKVLLGYLEVFRVPQFLIFATAAMAGTGGLFAYIAGSPFVFIDLLGLTATRYGWIFGTNALLFVIGSQANRAVLKRCESGRVLLVVTGIECIITLTLAGGSVLGILPRWFFLGLVASYMFCHAFVGPNAGALALLPFSRNVGSASASYTSMQMMAGALASGLLTFFHNGTRAPMTVMMSVCTGLSFFLAATGNIFLRRAR